MLNEMMIKKATFDETEAELDVNNIGYVRKSTNNHFFKLNRREL